MRFESVSWMLPDRDIRVIDGLLQVKIGPCKTYTVKLKNRRVIMAKDGDVWAIWIKTLVDRKSRKISELKFCLTEEAMTAFIHLYFHIKREST